MGFTTGAWAQAAVRGALEAFLKKESVDTVHIVLPSGDRYPFKILDSDFTNSEGYAKVKKDYSDDPDVTKGIEMEVIVKPSREYKISAIGGIGIVTKKGLPIPVGEAAINPVPRRFIKGEVEVARREYGYKDYFHIFIKVIDGEKVAKKTLNERLGIVGGISILGTTGIVIPYSDDAWKESILLQMNVAKEMGLNEVVISVGKRSEDYAMRIFDLPKEAFILSGDHIYFSLLEAGKRFKKIYFLSQFGKMCKVLLGYRNTHTNYGIVTPKDLGYSNFNTLRELYYHLKNTKDSFLQRIEEQVENIIRNWIGKKVKVILVPYNGIS